MKTRFTFACAICIFIVLQPAATQNLLQNGSFEKHGGLDCLTCPMWPEKFSAVLPHWRTLNGVYPFICDCQYKEDKASIEQGICPFDQVMPYHGRNMIEMDYSPSCYDQEMNTRGCSSYIGAWMDSPLDIGQVYEVSFWLFISPSNESEYAPHIGFNLYPDVVRNPKGKMLEGSRFLLDTVIYNRWYQVKWLVRPICNLQFLVLGVFRGGDALPVNGHGHHNRFYIDDVRAIRLDSVSADTARYVTPFCKYPEQEKKDLAPEIAGATCFFNPNDSLLSTAAMLVLDSFATRAKSNPLSAFSMSGNTDDLGANHLELSRARVKSVLDYLEKKHKIQPSRFFRIYLGNTNPAASNATENDRKWNRRVVIRQTDGLDLVIYRNMLLHVFAGEKDKAFQLIKVWLQVTKAQKMLYLLFDPRLDVLKSDSRWSQIALKRVKESYRSRLKPELAFLLDSLGREDQKCRTLKYYIENLNTYLDVVDSTDTRFGVHFSDTLQEACSARDEARLIALKKIIGTGDWPKISEVGERAAKSACFMLSHSSDTSSMAQYLPWIKQRCTTGEAAWLFYAMLFDRLQVHRGLPQRYGTQYKPPGTPAGKLELFPLENRDMVNRWRQEIGIELLEDLD